MELKYFYTPKTIYTVCTGISASSEAIRLEGPLFFYQADGRRVSGAINVRGEEGLRMVVDAARHKGHLLPEGVGEVRPFNLKYIKVCKGHVELRLPGTQKLGNPRLTFQFHNRFGSFNSAVKSALRTLDVYETIRGGLESEINLLDELDEQKRLSASQALDHYRVKSLI